MADMFKLIPSGFSFEEVDGYNKVLPRTIGQYFKHARGNETDLYVVKHYTKSKSTVLAKGYAPTTKKVSNAEELAICQDKLADMLDKEQTSAASYIANSDELTTWQKLEGKYAVIFAPCKDGIIGCGWYDHAGTAKKGLKMAAFVLYAYGFINKDRDEILGEVTQYYLPYNSELGRWEVAEDIIYRSMKPEVIEGNNRPTQVIKINEDKKNP